MIASSKLTFDAEYYRKAYSDWLRTRSRFRKFSLPVSLWTIILGFIILIRIESHPYLGFIVIGIGILHLIDALTYRSRWIKMCLSRGGSKNAQFEFYDDRMHMKTDHSEGFYLLSGLVDSIPCEYGIFLIPQKGLSFYIPWNSIEPHDALPRIQSLLSKIQHSIPPGS